LSNKLKHSIERDFTIAPNIIFKDRRLSYKAKGLWLQIISLPEGWEFSVKGLAQLAKENETAITSGLKELEACGYIEWRKYRINNQKFGVEVTTTLPIFSDEKTSHEDSSQEKIFDNKELTNKSNITPIKKSIPIGVEWDKKSDVWQEAESEKNEVIFKRS